MSPLSAVCLSLWFVCLLPPVLLSDGIAVSSHTLDLVL